MSKLDRPADRKNRSARTFLAGAFSGIVTSSALQPFDVVRTHLQASSKTAQYSSISARSIISGIVQNDGIKGLWRGTGATCIRIGFGAGLYFSLLDRVLFGLKKMQNSSSPDEKLSMGMTALAGGFTRAVAAAALCPVTIVKTRMEYSVKSGEQFKSTFHAIASIARNEGFSGLFRGIVPTLLRDAPYSGLYLVMYTRLRTCFKESLGMSQILSNCLAGAVAGATSTLVTHPPDVIRTRLQLSGGVRLTASQAVMAVYKKEGLAGFMKGVAPRVLKRGLQQALTWAIYEEIATILSGGTFWSK